MGSAGATPALRYTTDLRNVGGAVTLTLVSEFDPQRVHYAPLSSVQAGWPVTVETSVYGADTAHPLTAAAGSIHLGARLFLPPT